MAVMSRYSEALDAFLKKPGNSVTGLAEKVGTSQPNITRYRADERFPNADMARMIDRATEGEVSFMIWQAEFLRRAGVAA